MSSAEFAARYRAYAANCVRIAHELTEPVERLVLLDMAQAWIALTGQAEKNEVLFVVTETAQAPQHVTQQQQQIQPKANDSNGE